MSPDKLTYTFVLRNGLKWHDGQPVRAIDAVASLKRWAVKDAAGQKLMAKTASLEATDDKTLVLKLKEPYGLVLRALAKEYSYVPFIIPERQAVQPADKAFEGDKIGSGPFMFSEKEWVPGAKTVYLRNKDYVPRTRPARLLRGRPPRHRRPRGVDRHPRPVHGGGRPPEGRGRLHPAAAHRPVADPPQGPERHHEEGRRPADADPPEPPGAALRQREGPPGARPTWSTSATTCRRSPGTRRTGRSAGRSSAAGSGSTPRPGPSPTQKQDLAKAKQLLQEAGLQGREDRRDGAERHRDHQRGVADHRGACSGSSV